MRFRKTSFKAKALMDRTREFRQNLPKGFSAHPLNGRAVISLLPNLITLTGLCVGLTSFRFALQGQLEFAVIAILIAAIIDMLDGGIARMLNSTTAMGAELDSLSDLVTFGVAPGLVLYLNILNKIGPYGWMVVLIYVSCMALRLARFNVVIQNPDQPLWTSRFFVGVPAPIGAYLVLAPLMFDFHKGCMFMTEKEYAFYFLFVSLLLVSRIPTFSVKKITVEQRHAVPIMIAGIVFIGAFLTEPWLFLSIFSVIYVLSIPVSIYYYKKYKSMHAFLSKPLP